MQLKEAKQLGNESLCIGIEEVARMLNVALSTCHRYRSQGKLPEPIGLTRLLRWSRLEIQNWIEHGCPDSATWAKLKKAAR